MKEVKAMQNIRKIKVVALSLALAMGSISITSNGYAQEDDEIISPHGVHQHKHRFDKTYGFYAIGGVGFFDFEALNRRFGQTGYDSVDAPTIPIGITGDFRIGRLVLGAEWQKLRNFDTVSRSDNLRADIEGRYWLYRVGFDVVKVAGLHIYPLFGIGTGRIVLSIDEELDSDFDSVLSDPGRQSRLVQRGLLLDATLAVDYRFKIKERPTKTSYFTVGLRGGYLFAPYSGDWHTRSAEISGGPEIGFSGPTVQLMLGVSWKRTHTYTN